MQKLLSLSFILLGLATATAFAAPVTAPVDTPATATTKVSKHTKVAKKGHKKHKKHKKKAGN
jgi:hypothetical protein